ncbi:MAG: oxygen-independent coproporphyrinogen III oxidase [Hydrogenophilus sp.]|nr:oxygen-independent coproporphyrinogen III oxidase [Hydrogenophilus sp.]
MSEVSERERSITVAQEVVFDAALIRRFDVTGPRYTSYPTADRFTEAFGPEAYAQALAARAGVERPLSLYVHVPFCETVCYYCACNRMVTKDRSRAQRYVAALEKELGLVDRWLRGNRRVVQIHFGGGTPTFLSEEELRQVWDAIGRFFEVTEEGEFSIEVDPRRVSAATVYALREMGFNRMSIGVQDFDPVVQAAVNRVQPIEVTEEVLRAARAAGFVSVSFDLIYGLPHQNVTRFAQTLAEVVRLKPDRVSVFNYAHLPERFPAQRRIDATALPSAAEKLAILQMTVEQLTAAGYVYVGMDHFARPDDELAVAQRARRLHRNFQGYSTYAGCDLIGVGISAIGQVGPFYAQNQKGEEPYFAALARGELPTLRGVALGNDDLIRREVIQALMCHFTVRFAEVEEAFGVVFTDYFAPELAALEEMAAVGLVAVDEEEVRVLPKGRLLVRVVAMVFDRYLRTEEGEIRRYSRVI